jgi:LysR family glycine cleavage system transcriptional activator
MSATIPPLNPLRTFEAAARLSSLTHAAEELNVSQVAVSRQVKVLEDYLGVVLFKRLHRGIELTEEGRQLYEGVTRAFIEIGNAARRVSRRGRRDILAIQSYTTFSQRWLIPRLTQFHETFPRIEVRLSSSIAPVDFETQTLTPPYGPARETGQISTVKS